MCAYVCACECFIYLRWHMSHGRASEHVRQRQPTTWFIADVWMSHVTTFECVLSPNIWMRHVAIWIRHVTRWSQSRHTLERVASHTGMSHVTRHVTWAVLRVSWVKKTRRFVTSPIVVVGQAIIKVKWRYGLARCHIRSPCSRVKVRAPVVLNDREREPHKRFK